MSVVSKIAVRVFRIALLNGVLLATAVYLMCGPASLRSAASRAISNTVHFVSDVAVSSELETVNAQIAEDRLAVEAAHVQRDELQSRIRELVNLRNDTIAAEIELSDRLTPIFVALDDTANGEVIQVGDRAYRRQDVSSRALELEARRTSLERQVSEAEASISQLMSGLADLDQRIAAAQSRIDYNERQLRMEVHKQEGQRARKDIVRHLEALEYRTAER